MFMKYRRLTRPVRDSPGVSSILLLGIAVRVGFWKTYLPIWKNHAAFNVLNGELVAYIGDFVGYVPGRLPFYDVVAAGFYVVSNGILGIRSLSFSTLVLSCLSIPLFFAAISRFYDRKVALFSTVLYAFYPKFVVFSAIGMPDAAALSFLAFTLYAIARAERHDRTAWYAVAGIFALAAYLVQISAVLFAMLLTCYVYLDDLQEFTGEIEDLVPSVRVWAVAGPSGIAGVLFLVFGPSLQEISALSGPNFLFTTRTYSVVERTIRYVFHVHVDFWWHLQAWDTAHGLWVFVDLFQGFFGDLFPVYAGGWLFVTGILTSLILVGIASLVSSRDSRISLFVLAWIAIYVALFNFRNLGWSGSFRTYHVFPLFPAVAIAFGLGATTVADRIREHRTAANLDPLRFPKIGNADSMVLVAVMVLLLGFLLNAGVHGLIRTENEQAFKVEPIDAVAENVEPGETVAVFDHSRDFFNVVMYTEGAIRPVTITNERRISPLLRDHHSRDVLMVSHENVSTSNVDYVLALTPCTEISEWKQTYLDEVLDDGGEVVYRANSSEVFCSVNSVVVELP